jgi:hypothetical protein
MDCHACHEGRGEHSLGFEVLAIKIANELAQLGFGLRKPFFERAILVVKIVFAALLFVSSVVESPPIL